MARPNVARFSHYLGEFEPLSGGTRTTVRRARTRSPCPSDRRFLIILKPPEFTMSYVIPSEFVTKMVDAGESKIFMSTRDTLIRAYMAGAILALAAAFAVSVTVNTGNPLIGALLFPVGFCLLYLLGFDLLTGAFTLTPLAVMDRRPGCTWAGVLRNWGLVFRAISPVH